MLSAAPVASVNGAEPLSAPVLAVGLPTVKPPVTGTAGRTATVIVWVAVRTPLVAVTVKVSVVTEVAVRRCATVGV